MFSRPGSAALSRYVPVASRSWSSASSSKQAHKTAAIVARAVSEQQSDINLKSTSAEDYERQATASRVKVLTSSHLDIPISETRSKGLKKKPISRPSSSPDSSLQELKSHLSRSSHSSLSPNDRPVPTITQSSSSAHSHLSSNHATLSKSATNLRALSSAAAHQKTKPKTVPTINASRHPKNKGKDFTPSKTPVGSKSKGESKPNPVKVAQAVESELPGLIEREVEEAETTSAGRELPPHLATAPPDGDDKKLPALLASKGSISAADVKIYEVKPEREMKINRLRKELQRIPFSPGVHFMQDPRTGVWNFKPHQLHDIPTPKEYAYHRSPQYISPGNDTELAGLAQQNGVKYTGSTSTLTKAMSQIYFALSGNRGVDLSYLSQAFASERSDYTFGACLPACLILGKSPNGTIYVDSDKSLDIDNVLSKYGNILEKMLTTEAEDFKRFLMSSPESAVPESERTEREAYRYQRANKIIMRSQLDCYDPRLPGTGVFDIKTRAVLPIRHDRANYEANAAYALFKERGQSSSFEREYFDLMRAAMLKYSFQARIGMMDGIFLAYHNTSQIFGFQYVPLTQIDEHLFGTTEMAEQAFKLTTALLEVLLEEITSAFKDEEVNVTIKQLGSQNSPARNVTAFVQPREWGGSRETIPTQAFALKVESYLGDEKMTGPISFSVDEGVRKAQDWTVKYEITRTPMDEKSQQAVRDKLHKALGDLRNMMWISLPDGKTAHDMDKERAQAVQYGDYDEDLSVTKWKKADGRIQEMRLNAKASGETWEAKKKSWRSDKGEVYSWESPDE